MTHFFLTRKLLSESTFLAFISKVNEDFIALDTSEYEFYLANSQSFKLSATEWIRKCADKVAVKLENGVLQPFRLYALNRLKSLIAEDVSNFIDQYQAGKVKDTTRLLGELKVIQEHISSAPYLGPVADDLVKNLQAVPADILTIERVNSVPSVADNNEVFTWNGGIGTLCTLFHDLRTTKPSNSNKVFLDCMTKDLEDFIVKHFRDSHGNEFSRASIKTYLDPKRTDKKARKDRIDIVDQDQ